MFTRQRVQDMNETELRKHILIPLLRAMSYRDVFEYHGGVGEQGKDIICWKPDELGARINLAIVAKAVRLSGKASVSKGTAAEISMQVQQCFGKPFLEPVRGEEQSVHQCWVVSNKGIPKEAEDAIKSGIASDMLARNVRFIDGDRLWELIEKYLPTVAAIQKVQEAGQVFEELDTHFRVRAHTSPSGVELGIEEKFSGASLEKPFTIHGQFTFPATEEGRKAREAWEHHLSTGAAVEIPPAFARLTFPDFFQSLIGDSAQIQALRVGPAIFPQSMLVRIDIICDDGDSFSLDYIDLKAVQVGQQQVTLTNKLQPITTRVRLIFELASQQVHIEMTAPLFGLNVKQIYDNARLQQTMSKAGIIRVTHLDTGLHVFESTSSFDNTKGTDTLDQAFLTAMLDLVAIQMKLNRPINLPARDLSDKEVRDLNMLRYILRYGRLQEQWESLTIVVTAEAARDALLQFGDGSARTMHLERLESLVLFGVELPLGQVRRDVNQARLVNMQEVKSYLEGDIGTDSAVELRFAPGEDSTVLAEYLAWQARAAEGIHDSGADA